MKTKIVVLADYYFPSKHAGGPLKSISSVVNLMLEENHVTIITRNRDLGVTKPYEFINSKAHTVDGFKNGLSIIYCANYFFVLLSLLKQNPSFLWANSLFSRYTALGVIYSAWCNKRLVVSPRGELEPSAIQGSFFKRMYILLLRLFNLKFFVNSLREHRLLEKFFGQHVNVIVAPQLVARCIAKDSIKNKDFVFAGRLVPVKNLDFILNIISNSEIPINLDIFGTFECEKYRRKIMSLINTLDSVNYKGAFDPENVIEVLGQYRCLLMPSLGENFGHIIYEALCSRIYVLASNNTFWTSNYLKDGGKCLPLKEQVWLKQILSNDFKIQGDPALDYYYYSLTKNKSALHGLFKHD